ncbi:MAG: hypothetical protein LLG00_04760 [Planctomycetaceae bacterium]|nr:hypothetical protein [Planctomycetaceae bacterium]
MPRRFSIGAAMMLTAIFAILFGILRASDAPPVVFFVTLVFVAAIAMCQALLFGGKNPRKASILVGIVAGVLVDLAFVAVVVLDACYHHAHVSVEDIALMAVAVWAAFLVCTAFGYVIGWFVAAIFLVRKESDDPIVSTKDASGETRALGLEGNEQCGDVPNVAVK